jgi:hypothetical protein
MHIFKAERHMFAISKKSFFRHAVRIRVEFHGKSQQDAQCSCVGVLQGCETPPQNVRHQVQAWNEATSQR